MRIVDFLEEKKTAIKQRWLDLIVDTYPADSHQFFKKKKDRFQNPVGAVLSQQVETIYDILLLDSESAENKTTLEDLVKIRVVQDFTPAEALGFILFLKQAIREILAGDIRTSQLFTELLIIESRIDQLLLEAFNIYTKLRETIHKIRTDELRRASYLALKRMNLDPQNSDKVDDSDENTPN